MHTKTRTSEKKRGKKKYACFHSYDQFVTTVILIFIYTFDFFFPVSFEGICACMYMCAFLPFFPFISIFFSSENFIILPLCCTFSSNKITPNRFIVFYFIHTCAHTFNYLLI
ncbi:hypothetical protein, unlikely [Trypanosoma brucei gambiense DAL972]|uniref:Uncharacterized protein n=1 Tax=Trypanosoma brucei gambiense (strain MHOM/CI/86/DAL972) TaxID=679716 RepID=C9ZZM4_TRYB9|nr:hypothetical protein, unlikely [Trypanosoma brucei gambiense DAL972]CBH14873.1 hypothetical protein, unlikely [Trypanosoma brucei gambiense DAL972]|eukprot:XP_011777139.1 hypothetical protein, unlikely [Trypanosoma brucei gambiense DAL972]